MKAENGSGELYSHLTLYPTWFRWKAAGGDRARHWAVLFISHMVQMKGVDDNEWYNSNRFFISHMVQMKVYSI